MDDTLFEPISIKVVEKVLRYLNSNTYTIEWNCGTLFLVLKDTKGRLKFMCFIFFFRIKKYESSKIRYENLWWNPLGDWNQCKMIKILFSIKSCNQWNLPSPQDDRHIFGYRYRYHISVIVIVIANMINMLGNEGQPSFAIILQREDMVRLKW